MAKRFWRKLAALAKIETTYGTDAAPTGAANAILFQDVNFTPLEAAEISRDLLLPYMGHQGIILSGYLARLEGSVELAGAGDAGTAPAYGSLLRACGMSQVITAGTDVEYQPVSDGFEAVTFHYNRDGTRQAMLGCRGSWRTELTPQGIPRLRFNFLGLHGTLVDEALPALTLTGFIKPVPVNKQNSVFSLHGVTLPTESVTIDLGNEVSARQLINEETIQIADRRTTGSAVMEATQLSVKNWIATAKAHETGAMSFVHGTEAGNICEFAALNVQIGRPGEGQSTGIMNNTIPMMFLPTAGNDELSLIIR
ncbi:phage tail tube protein [Tianweitania sediminis]|uniref:Uncharacterized protein n=1 Tax=Tianweitania sediminis TaxID=1502156 RepID=A0A8J7RP55_9HYPH|nr:phage tail tube protein [Tianweitania sediminis]MBP0439434.1 hypothetical protein [Tianweitania sediminis]